MSQIQPITTDSIESDAKSLSLDNYENLKRLKAKYDSYMRSSTLILTWEGVNVHVKQDRSCFFFKSKPKPDEYVLDVDSGSKTTQPSAMYSSETDSGIILKTGDISSNESQSTSSSVSSTSGGSISSHKFKSNHILVNANGIIRSGESLAIMGASGSGKTTLLNVLNFRNLKKLNVEACVKLNGKAINENDLANRAAYIQQDDLFIPNITVKEHLTFLAMLKMGRHFTYREKKNRVEELLSEFNLGKCGNTAIGNFNNSKGISGGEKRRLTFASELLTDPQIMFCDEPISGLDSHMALTICKKLSEWARQGKIIISTIHQPSSQVFEKFDKLCLLSEGRVVYFGDREKASEFFSSMSYQCPNKYNPADYYIEILAFKAHRNNIQKLTEIHQTYEKSSYFNKTIEEIREVNVHYGQMNRYSYNMRLARAGTYNASYFAQFIWLFYRHIMNLTRESFATRLLGIQSIIIGLFLGFTYFQLQSDQSSIQNKNGLLFMVLLQTCLAYLFTASSQYHEQWDTIYRDVKNKLYSITIFYITKTFAELPKHTLFPFITISIAYWLANISSNVSVYLITCLIIVIAANTAVGFGTFLAVLSPNIDSTMGMIGLLFFPMLIFSGFLINNGSIPAYFIWMRYLSWVSYANEALMINLWSNVNELSCSSLPSANQTHSAITSCVTNGTQVLTSLSMDPKNFSFDIAMSVVMLILWPSLAGVILIIKTKF